MPSSARIIPQEGRSLDRGLKEPPVASPPRRPSAEAGKEAEPTLLPTPFLGLRWRSASPCVTLPPRWETPGPWRRAETFLFQQPSLHISDLLSVRLWEENPGMLKGKKKKNCKLNQWVSSYRQALPTSIPRPPHRPASLPGATVVGSHTLGTYKATRHPELFSHLDRKSLLIPQYVKWNITAVRTLVRRSHVYPC